jgi:carbamate kinase
VGARALIALGGNALCGADQKGTYAEQRQNARAMAASIGELIDAGWSVVVVHGNGPQVGALGVQQEEAATLVPAQPLSSLCAMTQGYLGSLIALALHERLGRTSEIVSVVTHVVVHGDDPALASTLGVEVLGLLTAVPAVHLDHGTPRQCDVRDLSLRDAVRHLAEGQFAAGSMGPKVAAAIRFIHEGGQAVAITSPALLAATIASPDGRPAGTLITAAGRSRAER